MSNDIYNNVKDAEDTEYSFSAALGDINKKVFEFYNGFDSNSLSSKAEGSIAETQANINRIYKTSGEKLVNALKTSIKELDSIRSKYIPWDIRKDIAQYNNDGPFSGRSNAVSSNDNKFFYESYENAFMRSLGMPSSSVLLNSDNNFIHYLASGSEVTNSNSVLTKVMLERENVDIRSTKISPQIFNVSGMFLKENLIKHLYLQKKMKSL